MLNATTATRVIHAIGLAISMATPILSRAPGRVELLGNHTDYNEGVVLSAAIDRTVTARAKSLPERVLRLRSTFSAEPVEAPLDALIPLEGEASWANYSMGVALMLQNEGFDLGGVDLQLDGDLPIGSGLSSSAALEVATALTFVKLNGLEIDALRLAKICRRAENDFVGVQSGLLDQVSSIFGRKGHAVFLDCRSEAIETIPMPARCALLVFDCGVPHRLTGGEYNERRAQCFAAARALGVPALRDVSGEQLERSREKLSPLEYRRAAHIIGEDERVNAGIAALRSEDPQSFGALMFASHESSRTNFENSTAELDALVGIARELNGVYGSRLTGGGFGGATISLVERADAGLIAQELATKYLAQTGNQGRAILCESADGAD